MADQLSASVIRHNGITILGLAGELDVATAPRLSEVLAECRGPLVLDCASLRFLDSSGLALLAETHRHNESLTLRRVTRSCRRVIDIAGLNFLVALEER
jgi:anti-sigma B factor antagonist